MADPLDQNAAQLTLAKIAREFKDASRAYEDARDVGDTEAMSDAMLRYEWARSAHNGLVGTQQQQPGQLSAAQSNFLSRRQAGGDQLTPERAREYDRAHQRALAAGLQQDSPEYFSMIEHHVDHLGDGRQPPLTPDEAARISGVSPEDYNKGVALLQRYKAMGHYQDR